MKKIQGNAVLLFLVFITSVFTIIQTRMETAKELATNTTRDSVLFISEDTKNKEVSLSLLANNIESYYDKHYKDLHKDVNYNYIYVYWDYISKSYKYFTNDSDTDIYNYSLIDLKDKIDNSLELSNIANSNYLYEEITKYVEFVGLKDHNQKILLDSKSGKYKNISPLLYISKTKSFDTGYGTFVPSYSISLLSPFNQEIYELNATTGLQEKKVTVSFKEDKVNTNGIINKKILSVMDGLDKVSNYISSKQKYLITTSGKTENSLAIKGTVALSNSTDDTTKKDFLISEVVSNGNCPTNNTGCSDFFGISSSGLLMITYDDLYKTYSGSTETVASNLTDVGDVEFNGTYYWEGGSYKNSILAVTPSSRFLFSSLTKIRNDAQDSYFIPDIKTEGTGSTNTSEIISQHFINSKMPDFVNFCGLNSYCGFKLNIEPETQMVKKVSSLTTANALINLFPGIGEHIDPNVLDYKGSKILVECGGTTTKGDKKIFLRGIDNPFSFRVEQSGVKDCPDKTSNLLIDNTSPFVFGENAAAKNQSVMIYALGVNNDLSCDEIDGTEHIDLCKKFPVIFKKYFIVKGQ